MTDDDSTVGFHVPGTGPPPYERLDAPADAKRRRRMRMLGVVNVILCLILGLIAVLLIGTMLPRFWYHHRVQPYPRYSCSGLFPRCPVLLISMDGFRHDYLELVRARYGPTALPNFARLEQTGIRAMRSINAFPTITLPNHRVLVTGLYPEQHGVVGNNLRDLEWPGVVFEMDNQTSLNEAPWLHGWPEPIWVTLQRDRRRAGSLLWPLTDGPVHHDMPFVQVSQFTLLDNNVSRYPYTKRVDDLLWWLRNPHYQLDLILAYFDEPDITGHAYGPESEQVAERIRELDAALGRLLDGLEHHKLTDKVDIILTADHGMTTINQSRLIALNEYVDPASYTYTQLSTIGFLYPEPDLFEVVYHNLSKAHQHLKVYRPSEVPGDLHFSRNSSRMPPLVLVPDPTWLLVQNKTDRFSVGNHGYTANFTDMNAFFIARGPSFRANETVPEVHALDVYELMSGLLRLRPRANNGSLERIARTVLKPEVADRLLNMPMWMPWWWIWMILHMELIWILVGLAMWIVLFGALITFVHIQRRHQRMIRMSDEFTPSAGQA